MNHSYIKLSALFVMLSLPAMSWALESDTKQPIQIKADEALINDKTGFTEYKGSAVLTQGSLKIEGDTIVFYFDDNKNITKAVAVGHLAKYQQIQNQDEGVVKARGKEMEYYPSSKTIIVTGQAYVTQNGDTFKGPRIKYDIEKNIVYAGQSAASGNTGKPTEATEQVVIVLQTAESRNDPAESVPIPEPIEENSAGAGTGFATARLNVRAEPNINGIKVGSLPPHGQFKVISESDEWLQIQTNVSGESIIGWVNRTYVKLNN